MGDEGAVDLVKLTGEIVEKALDSEPIKNLLDPLTKNIGQIFGLITDVALFYTEENLTRIFTKWGKQRKGRPLDEESFKRVLPLLRDAALQSDDELQDRWVSLLENFANGVEGVLPSFGQTLSNLSAKEARYLDKVWEHVSTPREYSAKRQGRDEMTLSTLIDLYSPQLSPPSPGDMHLSRHRMSSSQIAAFEEMTNFELMMHDLERLNLIRKEVKYASTRPSYIELEEESYTIPGEVGMIEAYALTQYGVSFILAVRPKRSSQC